MNRACFPEVAHAYRPIGKSTPLAIGLMFAAGIIASLAAGTAYGVLLGALLSGVGGSVASLSFVRYALAIGLAAVVGILVGGCIRLAGRLGRNRSSEMGLYAGVAAVVFALFAFFFSYGGQGFNWVLLVAIPLALALPTIGLAISSSEAPFCEMHQLPLKKVSVLRATLDDEGRALQILRSASYEELRELAAAGDEDGWCEVELEYCPTCQEGYVSLISVITVKGWDDANYQVRRIHCASVDAASVHRMAPPQRGHCSRATVVQSRRQHR